MIMSTWDNKAINGKDLQEQVVQNLASEIKKRGLAEVVAEALVNLDARMSAVENAVNEYNVGERIADSLDAQTLKVGGDDVAEALDSKIGNVKATAGPNIGNVGTPSVTVTNNPTTHESTLTFNYLKGAKGDKGDTGNNGTNGTNGVSCTHSWNGTTLTVTSASGTSSANLKGEKGDKGDTGTWGGTVDQTYNASSTNPQSGTAVAGAIANKQDKLGTTGSGANFKYTINISGTAGTADKATTVTVNSMSSTDRYVAFVDENGSIYKGIATYNLANNTLVCNLSGNATSATNASGYTSGGGIDLAIQQLQTAISGKEDKLVAGGTYNINVSKVGGYAVVVGPYSGVANTIYMY